MRTKFTAFVATLVALAVGAVVIAFAPWSQAAVTRLTGLTVDEFTQGGSIHQLAFTGTGSSTLTQTLLTDNRVFVIPASSTPVYTMFTVTLPATSTLTSFLPRPGDSREWIFQNENTTLATTTVLTAGTGWIFKGASTSADTIDGTTHGYVSCYRDRIAATTRAGDIVCEFRRAYDID